MKRNLVCICLLIELCLFQLPIICTAEDKVVDKKPIRVEFKLACDKDDKSCEKSTLEDSKAEIYTSKFPVITLGEISSAEATKTEVPEYLKEALEKAGAKPDPTSIALIINLNSKGKEKFAEITSQNIGKRIAVFINGDLVAAPQIRESILSGQLAISYDSFEKAKSIAERINQAKEPDNIK